VETRSVWACVWPILPIKTIATINLAVHARIQLPIPDTHNLLEKYASEFRALVNARVQGSDKSVRELLRLSREGDWNFLCAAMDIIGDASSAIGHIARFGLSGPTKYDDLGEKYLRLYGLLSATYVQQEAVLEVYRIMSVGDYKKAKSGVEALQIRKLRHKLSSHGTAYKSEAGTLEAYAPLRFEIRDNSVTAVNFTKVLTSTIMEPVNITEAIGAHSELLIELLDSTIEKSIETLFKGQDDKKPKHRENLKHLRIEREGGLVMKTVGGPTIIINFIGRDV
jgi:hypothetical protein